MAVTAFQTPSFYYQSSLFTCLLLQPPGLAATIPNVEGVMTESKSAPARKTKRKKKDGDLGDETSTVATINPPPADGRPPVNHDRKPKRPSV